MADTNSPLLGLLLMGTGGDPNAWGSNCNTQVFTRLENATAGFTNLSVTGGSHPMTTDEALSAHILLTGILTANQTIVVPGTNKKWTFINQTTGAFVVIVKAGAGTGVNVPQGTSEDLICTDANTVIRRSASKVGTLFYHMGATPPAGALECDGSTFLRASLVDLFAAVGTTWGVGDGFTTFGIMNAKDTGRVLRSRTNSVAVGTYQANQNAAHTHTASSSAVTGTTDTGGSHSHGVTDPGHTHGGVINGGGSVTTGSLAGSGNPQYGGSNTNTAGASTGISINSGGSHSHNITATAAGQAIASQGGTEARPEAAVALLCVWY